MEKLETLIEKTLQQLGYELVDLEISNRGKLLRVYIDKPDSVTIDDCTLVSNHLSRIYRRAGFRLRSTRGFIPWYGSCIKEIS